MLVSRVRWRVFHIACSHRAIDSGERDARAALLLGVRSVCGDKRRHCCLGDQVGKAERKVSMESRRDRRVKLALSVVNARCDRSCPFNEYGRDPRPFRQTGEMW